MKNNQLWSIVRRKIRSLKRRRRLRLWADNTIKVLPSNSRDLLHCSSFIFFTVLFLISFLLNTISFIFLCYLVNKSIYIFNVLNIYVLVFLYFDLFLFKLHLDRTYDNWSWCVWFVYASFLFLCFLDHLFNMFCILASIVSR